MPHILMEITSETRITIGLLAATVLIIMGGAWLAGQGSTDEGRVTPVAQMDRLVRGGSAVLGAQEAAVTVVEFGDFQCPACGALHRVLQPVRRSGIDQSVRFVFRQFPLPQHDQAQLAAEASLAAGAQGKFWGYHDLLFDNQEALTRGDLERYAEQLGLDMAAFRAALDEGKYREAVQQDVNDGRALGVKATPTVYINGTQYTGQYVAEELQAAIDRAR